MIDFDSYRESLKHLYEKLCVDDELIRIHTKTPLCFSATEWGDCFSDTNPRVLFLGKANNGAYRPKRLAVDELFDGNDLILSNGGGMKWIDDTWDCPNKCGWYPGRSPFFRVLRKMSEELCDLYHWKSSWYKYVAYGNFGKCNIDANPSPSMRIYSDRELLFAEMLNVDLKYLNPNFVICFTGSGDSTFWFSKMFLGYLDAVETDCVQWIGDNRFCIRVYHARGRYFLVSEHPQGKPEDSHVETMLKIIEKLWRTDCTK